MTDDASLLALRATSHPVRLQILSLLTSSELTTAEMVEELGLPRADVGYHLRQLLDAGMVEALPGRPGEEDAMRYRHPWDRERRVAEDKPTRQAWIRAMASELVRRVVQSADTRGHFADAELWVTPEEYQAVRTMMRECSARLHAEARPPRSEGTVKVSLTAALFEMAPATAVSDAGPTT